jgi:hypothetical protein
MAVSPFVVESGPKLHRPDLRNRHFLFQLRQGQALITARGLERLAIETDHAAVFLFRQTARWPQGEALVCWAVLDEKTARDITRQVNSRHFEEAFRQFNTRAYHLGTLLPPSLEDDVLLAS